MYHTASVGVNTSSTIETLRKATRVVITYLFISFLTAILFFFRVLITNIIDLSLGRCTAILFNATEALTAI
jgi:hypothetical protein